LQANKLSANMADLPPISGYDAFQPIGSGETKYGSRIGRPSKSMQKERNLAIEAETQGLAELKAELPAVSKEMSRRHRLKQMKQKYHTQRRSNVVKHIPDSRICPICSKYKPNNQQWSVVEGTTMCYCQGCTRKYGSRLKLLAELAINAKK